MNELSNKKWGCDENAQNPEKRTLNKRAPCCRITMTGGSVMGKKHYSKEFKEMVIARYGTGESIWSLHREFGVSRHGIQRWCGLDKVANMQREAPKRRGRTQKDGLKTDKEKDNEIKRLKMENDLLRDFLHLAGRK
jgi:transposase-like protein